MMSSVLENTISFYLPVVNMSYLVSDYIFIIVSKSLFKDEQKCLSMRGFAITHVRNDLIWIHIKSMRSLNKNIISP